MAGFEDPGQDGGSCGVEEGSGVDGERKNLVFGLFKSTVNVGGNSVSCQ